MVSSEDVPLAVAAANPARSSLLRWTVLAVVLLVLVDVAVTVAMWRWIDVALPDLDKRAAAHLDVLKLSASIAVGGGGLFALYLAARRQRTQEFELEERKRELAQRERVQTHAELVAEASRVHAEQVAKDNREDAVARRITELYSASVAQLGSDNATVRLGGLYALERLAQDNEPQRPMVVRVLCACLRMPFEMVDVQEGSSGPEYEAAASKRHARVHELEVRLAAQRILRDHLRADPVDTFWPGTDLDLHDATLIDFDLSGCTVRTADLGSATLEGPADFRSTTFTGATRFAGARFAGPANFRSTTFTGTADFRWATFTGTADFESVKFTGTVDLVEVNFAEGVPPDLAPLIQPTA